MSSIAWLNLVSSHHGQSIRRATHRAAGNSCCRTRTCERRRPATPPQSARCSRRRMRRGTNAPCTCRRPEPEIACESTDSARARRGAVVCTGASLVHAQDSEPPCRGGDDRSRGLSCTGLTDSAHGLFTRVRAAAWRTCGQGAAGCMAARPGPRFIRSAGAREAAHRPGVRLRAGAACAGAIASRGALRRSSTMNLAALHACLARGLPRAAASQYQGCPVTRCTIA
jgi:hypothetical protein